MKRILVFLAFGLLIGSVAYGQSELQQGQNEKMFPEAGSLAVGIEASPILDFVGNMFNANTNNKSANHWGNQNYMVYMRYYLFDKAAIRARLRVASNRDVYTSHVLDEAARTKNPLSEAKLEDKWVKKSNEVFFAAGYQMFRGEGRLRGFYGGEFFYSFDKENDSYSYGNAMTEFNPDPLTTTDFYNGVASKLAKRTLENKGSMTNSFGLNAFTGAEYYIFPQACIGFEVGIGFSADVTSKGLEVTEEMVGSQLLKREDATPQRVSSINFSTSNPQLYGNFYFMFHF